ncbi:hypothetical protein [Pseudoalteromonas sp. Of7M-16]|uniref:hypothetical protein n=1 Tax=Pseudoalteromonas sp. Of7M-16 TaxID=2917756 RepID=UPI001EF573D7|nr:hypothetical protein [Pseudoalteromonas sp. Of7M-16]MCG7549219.1 hypothetical protein [Pseudoalteromonas sp. Of7M-16]
MKDFDIGLIIRRAIDFLYINNGKATSLGICLGIVLDGILSMVGALNKTIDLTIIKSWHCIAAGVLGMNLPSYLNRKEVDPSITNAIEYIENGVKQGRVNEAYAQLMYKDLYEKVIESVSSETRMNETKNIEKQDEVK